MTYSTNPRAIERRLQRQRTAAAAGLGYKYSSKSANARAMVAVDQSYARQQATMTVERKCCTRCKTPFGICGNKACACHNH